jgi:hypothetical protein
MAALISFSIYRCLARSVWVVLRTSIVRFGELLELAVFLEHVVEDTGQEVRLQGEICVEQVQSKIVPGVVAHAGLFLPGLCGGHELRCLFVGFVFSTVVIFVAFAAAVLKHNVLPFSSLIAYALTSTTTAALLSALNTVIATHLAVGHVKHKVFDAVITIVSGHGCFEGRGGMGVVMAGHYGVTKMGVEEAGYDECGWQRWNKLIRAKSSGSSARGDGYWPSTRRRWTTQA